MAGAIKSVCFDQLLADSCQTATHSSKDARAAAIVCPLSGVRNRPSTDRNGARCGRSLAPLVCYEDRRCCNAAHNRVGYMLRPLPAKSGRVQGRLLRPRQLSGSSLILEVLCQNSASCVIEPMNTKVGSVGTVAASCHRPQTRACRGAPRNTFVRDAMVAEILPITSWPRAGYVTAGGTGERCRCHQRSTERLFGSDWQGQTHRSRRRNDVQGALMRCLLLAAR
jgi:hypothetical protein